MRNLRASVGREERALTESEHAATTNGTVRTELKSLERRQKADQAKLDDLNERITPLDAEREDARLDALRAETEHESAYRDLERKQLAVIAAAFPTAEESTQYLLTKLMSDGLCLVCGNKAPAAEKALRSRVASHHCVICESEIAAGRVKAPGTRSILAAEKALARAVERRSAARGERGDSESAFDDLVTQIRTLSAVTTKRSAEIDVLVATLPPDEAELHKQREDLAILRGRVEVMRKELDKLRGSFARFINGINNQIVDQRDVIQATFQEFALGFLLEESALVWAPHKTQVGEEGRRIDFPAFQLDMSGADFSSPVRRSGPEQVSESQREFIDLAFRMTLMRVAGTNGGGSLVMDAPESSLDAVFVTRAAKVLSHFAKATQDTRVVVTSNLVDGPLIPELSRQAGIQSLANERVVDLFRVAEPTAATRELKNDYDRVRRRLFRRRRRPSR